MRQTLADTLDARPQVRRAAEQKLLAAEGLRLEAFVQALGKAFGDELLDPFLRQAAGLRLKNSFAVETKPNAAQNRVWTHLSSETRAELKTTLLKELSAQNHIVAGTAAQLCAFVARMELPNKSWPEFFPVLMRKVAGESGLDAQCSSLRCISLLCEDLSRALLERDRGWLGTTECDLVLRIVIRGLHDADAKVRLVAMQAFYHALMFAHDSFDKVKERDYIMERLMEGCQGEDPAMLVASLTCLVQVASEFYDFLHLYMDRVGSLTLNAISSPDESVALAAIEFWSSLAEEEIARDGRTDLCSAKYVTAATPFLLPRLFEALMKQESEENESEQWSLPMAAGACLNYTAEAAKDAVVEPALKFVQISVESDDWRRREAAILTYGCIMEGPSAEALMPYVKRTALAICRMLGDSSVAVRDSAAWTIGRISAFHPCVLAEFTIALHGKAHTLIDLLVARLSDVPRVAVHVCWALQELAEFASGRTDEAKALQTILSASFDVLCHQLCLSACREDAGERNLRDGAYSALTALVGCVQDTCYPQMYMLMQHGLNELSKLTKENASNSFKSCLCGVLQALLVRLGDRARPLAVQCWNCLQAVLAEDVDGAAAEDALLAISPLVAVAKGEFVAFMDHLVPLLLHFLGNLEAVATCKVALDVVGDLCHALGEKIAPWLASLSKASLHITSDPNANRVLKPLAIMTMADLATAAPRHWEPFLEPFVALLRQAEFACGEVGAEEWERYVDSLLLAVLESYSTLLYAMKDVNQLDRLTPHVQPMLDLAHRVAKHRVTPHSLPLLNAAVALTADLVAVYGARLSVPLGESEFVRDLMERSYRYSAQCPDTRAKAELLRRAFCSSQPSVKS